MRELFHSAPPPPQNDQDLASPTSHAAEARGSSPKPGLSIPTCSYPISRIGPVGETACGGETVTCGTTVGKTGEWQRTRLESDDSLSIF